MTKTTAIVPLYLNEIELDLTGEVESQKYYIYRYIHRPETYIVYLTERREQGISFRQTTLDRVILNIERFLATPRPTCL